MKKLILPIFVLIFSFQAFSQYEVLLNGESYSGWTPACNDSSITLTASYSPQNSGPDSCIWYAEGGQDTLSTTFSVSVVPTGAYTTVTLSLIENGQNAGDYDVTIFYFPIFISDTPSVYGSGYNISTYGANDGAISLTIQGGSPGFSYAWSNNSSTQNISGLVAGTYSVTVTDQIGCTATLTRTLIQPVPLQITSITSPKHNNYNISCKNGNDGAINLTVTGGVPPYSYQWNNGAWEEDPDTLQAGTYSVIVRDALNVASDTGQITLTQPQAISIGLTPTIFPNGYNVSCNNCYNGSLTANISGGVSPFLYVWGNGDSTLSIDTLGSGEYEIFVTDANGCTRSNKELMRTPERDDWSMNGNIDTDTATHFIGTFDNKDFILKTNNTERLRIKNDGKINFKGLVNFDSISIKRQLKIDTLKINRIMAQDGDSIINVGLGSFHFNQNSNNIYTTHANNASYKGFSIGYLCRGMGEGSGAFGYQAWATGITSFAFGNNLLASGDHSMVIGSGGASTSVPFLTNSIPYSLAIGFNSEIPTLFVSESSSVSTSGNVGIGGTTSPAAKLQIDHDDSNGGIFMNRLSSTTSHSEIRFNQNGVEQWAIGNDYGEAGNDNFFIYNQALQQPLMLFSNDGAPAVGIGCNPGDISSRDINYKLYVEGSIAAREIKVTAGNFPDYVFSKNHPLMSLSELDEFIHKNKHLPGIPSAKEVEANNGFEVGEMQQKLLEKIEEQTLYIILLQKQIDELKAEVKNYVK